MNKDILRLFETMPYFTIEGFRQVAGIEKPYHGRVLMHRWLKAGHILQLRRGMYMTRSFYLQHRHEIPFSAAVSSILLPQSYVSLEFILQRYNILTEATYPVTCTTPRNTRRISNPLGTFWYRHIQPDLYHGYTISEYFGIRFAEASVAKALFDYLHLRPIPPAFRSPRINLAEELRLNLDVFSAADRAEFAGYVEESKKRKMIQIHENFKRTVWRP